MNPRTAVIPAWYHVGMAMTLRLTDEETEALRRTAEAEGRSMQEVARDAIRVYVSGREQRIRTIFERIAERDAELLDRLGQ